MNSKATLSMPRTELRGPADDVSDAAATRSSVRGASAVESKAVVTNAFTIDVEDYYHVSALASAISETPGASANRVSPPAPTGILALLDERRIKGTFFVLGWVADKVPQLVKRIAALGHEVACHGYSHELIYRQTPAVFAEETRRSKSLLEDLDRDAGDRLPRRQFLDHAAVALGARHADRARASPTTLRFSRCATIATECRARRARRASCTRRRADASPNSRCRRRRSGRCAYRFPEAATSACCPTGSRARACAASTSSEGLPFTFYLHPWEIDVEQPRVKTSLVSRFRHYTNLVQMRGAPAPAAGDFRFTTMRNVLRARGLLSS